MQAEFTPVTMQEIHALQRLCRETFIAAYSPQIGMQEMLDYLDDAHSLEALSEELNDPDVSYFFVSTGQGEPAGFIMLRKGRTHPNLGVDPAVLLNRIYLLPPHWGTGLAAQMMDFSEAFARKAGVRWLWLQVWQENRRAIAFYRKRGFEQFGFMEFKMKEVVHEDWVMRKKV